MAAAHPTRVAVVQLAYHPATLVEGRSPLCDPLYEDGAAGASTGPWEGSGPLPPELAARLRSLGERVRRVHAAQLVGKAQAILAACRRWGVRLVVFPESSLACEVLPAIAAAAGDMVVIAGTHAVDEAALASGVYEALDCPKGQLPRAGEVVCPALHRGRLLALQPGLDAASAGRWAPIDLPEEAGIPGPIGALVGRDLAGHGGAARQGQVARGLAACRLLAVLDATDGPGRAGVVARAVEEARRLPVALATHARAGGSTILAAGAPPGAAPFPEGPGALPEGDEGVVVADLDLGGAALVAPFACASLVYRTHPHGDAFAAWIETLHQAIAALPAGDPAGLFELLDAVDERRQFLLDAGALPGANARGRRYEALLARLGAIQSGEELARYTREVIVPPTVLPFEHVREAMALGAHEALHRGWQEATGEAEAIALMAIARRLKAAGQALRVPPPEMWTEAGRRTIAGIRAALVGGSEAAPREAPRGAASEAEEAQEAQEAQESPPRAIAPDDADAPLARQRPQVLRDLAVRRRRKLADVDDHYEPPLLAVDGAAAATPALAALDAWLADDGAPPRALLLGDHGAGKSTLLTVWAERRWRGGAAPLPVLVPLRGAAGADDAEALLLRALGRGAGETERDWLRRLLRARALVPCFDGVDEVLPGGDALALASRLQRLAAGVGPAGKLLIAARDPGDDTLARALPGARRLALAPLTEDQIAHLIAAIRRGEGAAQVVLRRLAHAYDLAELVRRPLLLGMVLQGLDELDPSARVGAADVYSAYVARWLRARPLGDPAGLGADITIVIAEELADELWRSGLPTCPIRQLRTRAIEVVSEAGAVDRLRALDEIEGGYFLVRDGDALRFAHRSFLEYFLARGLVRHLAAEPARRLATRPLTREVIVFVDQLLRRGHGDPLASPPIQGLRGWLMSGAEAASPGAGVDPRVNALRLLLHLPMLGPAEPGTPHDTRPWVPAGARLAGVDLRGEDLRHARLADVVLAGADLRGADLRRAELCGSDLHGAHLAGADLRGADLRYADLCGSDLRGARLADADLREARLEGARGDVGDVAGARTRGSASPLADREAALERGAALDLDAEGLRSFDVSAELEGPAEASEGPRPIEVDDAADEAAAPSPPDDDTPRLEGGAADTADTAVEAALPAEAGPASSTRPAAPPPPAAAPAAAPRGSVPEDRSLPAPPPASHESVLEDRSIATPPAPSSAQPSTLGALLRKLAPAREPPAPQRRLRQKIAERAHALAPNPFLPGRPLRDADTLPGRQDILAELTTLIQQRSPALLKGPRRAGKSSILYTLARTEGERRQVYHRSLEGRAPRTPGEFAALVEPSLRGRADPAEALLADLAAAPAPPVILLDEVAWLTRADEALFPWLRVLGQEGACALVLAGSHSDWLAVIRQANRTPGSSFGNDYTIVELEALSEAAAIAFLVDTAPPDVEIDPDRGARWIVELCGGWPFYLQVMGYAVVEEARQGKRAPLVDKGALFDLYERRLLRDRVAVFSSRWVDLRPAAQRVMLAVLEGALRTKSGRALTAYRDLGRRERAILSDAGVIDAQRGWLLDLPFRDWLLRNFDELEVSDGEAL